MELILWRHAKAEKQAPELADESRDLTPKGRKKARAAAKGLARYLPVEARIEIWASPARRSKETASILADTLGGITVKEYPAIYNGVLGELIAGWRACTADVIVVVGHESYLSGWARRLANVTVPFKKCAAAGFTFLSPEKATLTWFACPKSLAILGKKYKGV